MQGLAHVATTAGEVSEVLPLVDEAAALAMRPGSHRSMPGYVYCAVISICRALCDWGRATEWTKVSTRYCEHASITGFTGLCRFHQGEIDRLHGQLAEAEQRVLHACEELLGINRYRAGWGYSELVEIRVRRGDLTGAEEALAEAIALGDDGQPGQGRLLLAQRDYRAATGASAARSQTRASWLGSAASSSSPCTSRRASRWVTSRRRPRASPSWRNWPEGSAPLDRRPQRRSHTGTWRSIAATPRRRSPRCDRGCAPGAKSTPRTRPPGAVLFARALTSEGDDAGAPRAQGRRPPGRRVRRRRRPRHRSRPARGRSNHPHVPFSDIVDSTRLAEAMGDAAWEPLLRWRDRTLRAEFERWNGEEIKHGGDGFFVAFGEADDGITCAVAIQRALSRRHRAERHPRRASASDSTPAKQPRAMGISLDRRSPRAARISAAAGAGEVLASADLVAGCRHEVPLDG